MSNCFAARRSRVRAVGVYVCSISGPESSPTSRLTVVAFRAWQHALSCDFFCGEKRRMCSCGRMEGRAVGLRGPTAAPVDPQARVALEGGCSPPPGPAAYAQPLSPSRQPQWHL